MMILCLFLSFTLGFKKCETREECLDFNDVYRINRSEHQEFDDSPFVESAFAARL